MVSKENSAGRRRIVITIISAGLLLLLYYTIFHFSAQNGEESSSLSQRITRRSVEIVSSLSGSDWNVLSVAELQKRFEHFLRKLAHFSEYACMGVLVFLLLSQWLRQGRRLYVLTIGWVFLSAVGDEFHQFFVPGRYASPLDVLLDTFGGVCGMFFCVCILVFVRRREKSVQRKKRV